MWNVTASSHELLIVRTMCVGLHAENGTFMSIAALCNRVDKYRSDVIESSPMVVGLWNPGMCHARGVALNDVAIFFFK